MSNSETYYSIEWLPFSSHFDCWNQFALTKRRWLAKVYLFDLRISCGWNSNHYRIREV